MNARPGQRRRSQLSVGASEAGGITDRYFHALLFAICVAGGILHGLILLQHLARNPLAEYLRVDALTYWNWAGRIAAGQLTDGRPFFSAPLYPYLLGAWRAAGAGLAAVYAAQVAMNLLTAGLLGVIAKRLLSPWAGWLAAAMYLLMLEPTSFSLRVLAPTVQLLLIAVAWLVLLIAAERGTLGCGLLSGAVLGLLALSYPPAVLCLPVAGTWWWWTQRRKRLAVHRATPVPSGRRDGAGDAEAGALPAVLPALLMMVAGLAVIAPATIHNYLVSGEFFAIQAVSGLTLRQGNGPGAQGVIIMIPGTSTDRESLFDSARNEFRRRHGRDATWGEIDRQYRAEVFAYWREDIGRTLRLFARRLYWFLTGRHFADIYMPTLEIAEGLLPRLRLTPLHTAWLLPVALVALMSWLRSPGRHLPALMFFVAALATVVIFRYSPRYRLPAVPVIVVAAAWTAHEAWRQRWRSLWTTGGGLGVAAAIGLTLLNAATGFDSPARQRPLFLQSIGAAALARGQPEKARDYFQAALTLRPDLEEVRLDLAETWRLLGRLDESLVEARRVLASHPQSAQAHRLVGIGLALQGRPQQALEHFRQVVALDPADADARVNLANALSEIGALDEAVTHYRAALELRPQSAPAWFNLGKTLRRRGAKTEARAALRNVIRLAPDHLSARYELVHLLLEDRQYREAATVLRQGYEQGREAVRLANDLAWLLATCPDEQVRDGREALRLARQACDLAGAPHPGLLDTLAAALAAGEQFEDAHRTAIQAAQLAQSLGDARLAEQIRQRAEVYAAGQAWYERP